MKKVILSLAVVSLLSVVSCKEINKAKEEAGNAVEMVKQEAEKTTDNIQSAISGIEVPKFENADVQKFANEYAAYFKEIADATKAGNFDKLKELQAKAQEWTMKAQEQMQKMSTEDSQKWSEWAVKLAQYVQ